MRRVSVTVPAHRVEQARARMLVLFPEGFEEASTRNGVELAAYTDARGEERLWEVFGGASGIDVDEGWEDRWRTFHRPITVGPLWVGPPWEQPPSEAIAVVIEPGRAFGTGSHATTRMCLSFLLRFEEGSVLDLGCGSGVVAVAAAKLGLTPVTALDNDPAAVEASRANAAANEVSVDVRQADALFTELPPTDVAVVNISLEGVLAAAPRLSSRWLIASGYLESEQPQLDGYRTDERVRAEGWAADLYERLTE